MTELTDTALVPLAPAGDEVALPAELIERAKDYMAEALAERSREAYARHWARFQSWCRLHGRQDLPASPDTIAAFLAARADGADGGRPWARSTLNQCLAAITWVHRSAGHALDRKHRVISTTWSGISRVKALVEIERQAAPFLAADVRDLLAILNPAKNIGCRNAALLTLGFGAALHRSELVGLDWQQLGTGSGFVRIDERGILITIARSKGSQDKAETVVIPRADFLPACEALEAWAARAQLQSGDAIFRPVNNRHQIATERLTAQSVSRIVKRAMGQIARKRGKTLEETKALIQRFSGHSLRAGFVTSAAAVDVPPLRIAQHTRHKSLEMVNRYCREADKYNRSALRGVFAPATEATP
jgi:integrase